MELGKLFLQEAEKRTPMSGLKKNKNTRSVYDGLTAFTSVLFRLHRCTWIPANLQFDRIPKYLGCGANA